MSNALEIDEPSSSEFEENDDFETEVKKKGRGFDGGTAYHTVFKRKRRYDEANTSEARGGDAEPKEAVVPHKSVEGWVIFVTGINEEANDHDLKELFSEHGNITNYTLNLDRRTGFVKGYAMIEYETFEQALNTIESLNNFEWLGSKLGVSWAFAQCECCSK